MRFAYLGCDVTYGENEDINNKLNGFQYICGMIQSSLKNRVHRETFLRLYKTMALPHCCFLSNPIKSNKK